MDNLRAEIAARYRGRCVVCLRPASDVHEIVPRSQGGKVDLENSVTLCRECHTEVHETGTRLSSDLLRERAAKVLAGINEESHSQLQPYND
jgi:5-methylcytosine-specific restriction endonuclease McrA